MMVSYAAPRFGSTDIAPLMNLTSHVAEEYRNNSHDKKLRQEILSDLQNQRPDLFTANSPLTQTVLSKPTPYMPPAIIHHPTTPVHFGMLGMGVHIGGGKKNEAGISTFVSNGGTIESLTLTRDEIEYVKAKQEWREAKNNPNVSDTEKARLKKLKQELKAGAKLSKKRKERINTLLSLGCNLIPGPAGTVLGQITKPVAVAAADDGPGFLTALNDLRKDFTNSIKEACVGSKASEQPGTSEMSQSSGAEGSTSRSTVATRPAEQIQADMNQLQDFLDTQDHVPSCYYDDAYQMYDELQRARRGW